MIIYKITNKINGKTYIGQTIRTLEKRWSVHCVQKGHCPLIYNAIKKYGKENFTVEQIDSASSLEELNKKETEYINLYNSLSPLGYNLNTGGGNRIWSEESKLRMSKSHKGKKLSKSHRKNISKAVKEVFEKHPEKLKNSQEAFKEKVKEWQKQGYSGKRGVKLSEESKKRISEAKKGSKNPQCGKPLNEEQSQALLRGRQKRIQNLPRVLCHQNGIIYDSVTEAAKSLGFARPSVSNVLTGFRKSCKGCTFEYVPRETT